MRKSIILQIWLTFGLLLFNSSGLLAQGRQLSILGKAENDGSGKGKQKNLRIPFDKIGPNDTIKWSVNSGKFKFLAIHARFKGGIWRDIYKGNQIVKGSYLVRQVKILKDRYKSADPTEYVVTVNGIHTRFEKIPCVITLLRERFEKYVPKKVVKIQPPTKNTAKETISSDSRINKVREVLLKMQKAAKGRSSLNFQKYLFDQVITKGTMLGENKAPKDKIAKYLCDLKNVMGNPFQDSRSIDKRLLSVVEKGGTFFATLIYYGPISVDLGMSYFTTREKLPSICVAEFRERNGRMLLTCIDIVPPGFYKNVYQHFANKLKASKGKNQSSAVSQYRKDFAKYVKTLKRSGITGTTNAGNTRNVKTKSTRRNINKRAKNKIVSRPLSNPKPVLLPDSKVTPAIRKARKIIDIFVNKNFPEFKGKVLFEDKFRFEGSENFIKIFLKLYEVILNGEKYRYNNRLVLYTDGTGKVRATRMPVVKPLVSPPPYNPKKIYWKPDKRKIKLPVPKKTVRDCMVLTNLKKLREKYPLNFKAIEKMLKAYGPIIDIGNTNINPRDWHAIDKYLEKQFNRNKYGSLFIFGNDDVLPYCTYSNPCHIPGNPKSDSDVIIESDDYYADFDHDKNQDWDIILTRLPDDRGILEDPNSVLYRSVPKNGGPAFNDYVVYGNPVWPDYNNGLAKLGNSSRPALRLSAPYNVDSFSSDFFKGHNVFLNLHGGKSNTLLYWGEEKDSNRNNQILTNAINVDQAKAVDSIIICTCCYGAYTKGKTSENNIALRFLKNGARAYIGNSRIGYADVGISRFAPTLLVKWSMAFKRYVDQGLSPPAAFMMAKREYARTMNPANQIQFKMCHQLLYLGLPPGSGHAPDLKKADKIIADIDSLVNPDSSTKTKTSSSEVSKHLGDFEIEAHKKPDSIGTIDAKPSTGGKHASAVNVNSKKSTKPKVRIARKSFEKLIMLAGEFRNSFLRSDKKDVSCAERSIAYADEAYLIRPSSPLPWVEKARTYMNWDKRLEAVEYAKKAREIAPDDPNVIALLKELGLLTDDLPVKPNWDAGGMGEGPALKSLERGKDWLNEFWSGTKTNKIYFIIGIFVALVFGVILFLLILYFVVKSLFKKRNSKAKNTEIKTESAPGESQAKPEPQPEPEPLQEEEATAQTPPTNVDSVDSAQSKDSGLGLAADSEEQPVPPNENQVVQDAESSSPKSAPVPPESSSPKSAPVPPEPETTIQRPSTIEALRPSLILGAHEDAISSLDFHPKSQLLASASHDKKIIIWDVSSGAIQQRLKLDAKINAVLFSPDGQYLAAGTAANEENIQIWQTDSWEKVVSLRHSDGDVKSLAFSATLNLFVSGAWDGSILLWDLNDMSSGSLFDGSGSGLRVLRATNDGKQLAASFDDGSVRLWSLEDRSEQSRFMVGKMGVNDLLFSEDHKSIISCDGQKSLKIWNARKGKLTLTHNFETKSLETLAFLEKQNMICAADDSGTLFCANGETLEAFRTFKAHEECVNSLSLSHNGEFLASGSDDNIIKVWMTKDLVS